MKKNQSKFLYALDIGSKKMTLAAAAIEKNGTLGPLLIETRPSRGIFKGVVNDLATLSDAVSQLFKAMEIKCRSKATQTALSINGNYINSRNSVAAVALSERGMRSITKRDVEKLTQQARTLGLELDELLLHEHPQGYSVDRHNMTLHPLGLHGRRFEMDLLLVYAPRSYVENITRAVEQAGLDISNLVFSSLAASRAVLSESEKEKGVILIDIGDAMTSVLVFKDGMLRRLHLLSFGGRNLTEILSHYFKISFSLAEDVKESALEIDPDIPETEEVMVKTEEAYRPIKKKELVSVILPEIEKFLGALKNVIFDNSSSAASLPVVVTGGLSLLAGLLEKMERELDLPVKMGTVRGSVEIPAIKAPAFAASIGLLYQQRDAHHQDAMKFQAQGKTKITKFIDYLTNLYQDYF